MNKLITWKNAVTTGLLTMSMSVMAQDTIEDKINAAEAAATTNVTAVSLAVIGVAAVTFGLVAITSWLRK